METVYSIHLRSGKTVIGSYVGKTDNKIVLNHAFIEQGDTPQGIAYEYLGLALVSIDFELSNQVPSLKLSEYARMRDEALEDLKRFKQPSKVKLLSLHPTNKENKE